MIFYQLLTLLSLMIFISFSVLQKTDVNKLDDLNFKESDFLFQSIDTIENCHMQFFQL